MVLLADAGVFTGAVTELPAGVADDEPAANVADPSPLALGPDESAATPSSSLLGFPIVASWFSTSSDTYSGCSA